MATVRVTVAWITPEVQDLVSIVLERGSTLGDAVAASRLASTYGLDLARMAIAVAGERRDLNEMAHDGERVDLLRPLTADPKEARRARAHLTPLRRTAPRTKRRSRVGST